MINELDIRRQLDFLKFIDEIEIRMFNKQGQVKRYFCKNSDEVINIVKKYNSKFNIYVGLNERKASGSSIQDVKYINNIYFDIDAHNSKISKEQLADFIQKIIDDFDKKQYGKPLIIDSGWGYWLIYSISPIQNTEENRKKLKIFSTLIDKTYSTSDIKLDIAVTSDVARIGRLAGTINLRDEQNPILAKILNPEHQRLECQVLSDFILSIQTDNQVKKSNIITSEKLQNLGKFFNILHTIDLKDCNVYDTLQKNEASWYVETGNDIDELRQLYLQKGWNFDMTIGRWYATISTGKDIKVNIGELINWLKRYEEQIQASGLNTQKLFDLLQEHDIKNFITVEELSNGKLKKTVNIDAVADYIINKFNIRTITGIREETIEIYIDGIWETRGKGIIKAEIERLLKTFSKNNVVSEILEKIKRKTDVSRDLTELIPDYKRCFNNCVLDFEDVSNIRVLPHSKDYNFRNKFPINYNPLAKCNKILKFIASTFYEEDIQKIQEWFGIHLIRRHERKKAALFFGPKNTGKTVVLNLLEEFVGHNTSGLSLQLIGRGKAFDILDLKDKDANICDDLSSNDMDSIGKFKQIVGDGWIEAEMKFGDRLKFKNTAKNTMSCNQIPLPRQDIDDDAYYDRWLLFPLENVVQNSLMNKELIKELTTPEELSGLLNWSIEGYVRLSINNKFTNDKTPEEKKFLMQRNGNSISIFALEALEQSNGNKITKDEMYKIYCNWCDSHVPKLSPDSKDKLGKTLNKYISYIISSTSGNERYWLNVKKKDIVLQIDNIQKQLNQQGEQKSNLLSEDE